MLYLSSASLLRPEADTLISTASRLLYSTVSETSLRTRGSHGMKCVFIWFSLLRERSLIPAQEDILNNWARYILKRWKFSDSQVQGNKFQCCRIYLFCNVDSDSLLFPSSTRLDSRRKITDPSWSHCVAGLAVGKLIQLKLVHPCSVTEHWNWINLNRC